MKIIVVEFFVLWYNVVRNNKKMNKPMTKIEVDRDDEWVQVPPEELTTPELCESLSRIMLDSDEFIPQKEIDEGYSAIAEAIRRLERMEKKNDNG